MPASLPLIFALQRFARDDGPGIRTTVFLKGCPLNCSWCHNPEGIRSDAEVAYYPDLCSACAACAKLCPVADLSPLRPRAIVRSACIACGRCVATCPARARRMIGEAYRLEELLALLRRDADFFAASGGGVTFSGGEPTLEMDYLQGALRELQREKIPTALQTCGLFVYEDFRAKLLPHLDLIMFDLKFIDAAQHRRYTGQDNKLILENFRRLSTDAPERLLPRVPLVPGVTATPENLGAIAAFLVALGRHHCDLLPYNPAGAGKRQSLGMKAAPPLASTLTSAEEGKLRDFFAAQLA